MRTITLKNGLLALIDDEDFGLVSKFKWHARRDPGFKREEKFYVEAGVYVGKVNGKYKTDCVKLHRLIMGLCKGDGLEVDHINGDTLDNRRSNLRICTRKQNCHNMRIKRTNTSGFVGIDFIPWSKRWRARITLDGGARKSLGCFPTKEEAANAYDGAAKLHYKEFAKTNS